MKSGFTLIEVVVALLIMEIATLGVLGTLVLASNTMRQAETLERAAARAEGVLDSLRVGGDPGTGSRAFLGGEVHWVIDARGSVTLTAVDEHGGTLIEVRSRVSPR